MQDTTYLTQEQASKIDEELMGALGFSVDQLMELAGLSVACAIAAEYPSTSHPRVLVLAGPGNNGGDGLVAARHLHHFGYRVQICYPKRTDKPLYHGLVTQANALQLEFVDVDALTTATSSLRDRCDVVIDALFGFSFKGTARPPFDALLQLLSPAAQPPPIVSVDIPSGWDVEKGDVSGDGIRPDMLVSLTAPKLAAEHFTGKHHYLGGRFVPPAIREKYALQLPTYSGTSMCVRMSQTSVADMRVTYAIGELMEEHVDDDPMKQFATWFDAAVASNACAEPNAMTLATCSSVGSVSARMVLLKGFDDRGFVFYTNYNSRKGRELIETGRAALCMYWDALQRQVRVEGTIEKVPEHESDEYFHSRPRGSQIGAWVSEQSATISSRAVLQQREEELKAQYADGSVQVPRPPHWGGFLVRPLQIEFWQGRPSRLHDRLQYSRQSVHDSTWSLVRLSP